MLAKRGPSLRIYWNLTIVAMLLLHGKGKLDHECGVHLHLQNAESEKRHQ